MSLKRAAKEVMIQDIKSLLSEAQLTIVIDYQGLSVSEITDLRRRLRETGTECKVAKNTLMRLVVEEDENWKPMVPLLKGASAFLFVKDDLGAAVKAYQAFQKDTKKSDFRGGVMQGQALNQDQVKAITELPTKEELMAQIAGAINSLATKVAVGIKEVPSSICRSVNEVPASLGRGIHAIATKEEGEAA